MALKDTYGGWARHFARAMGEGWNGFLDAIDTAITTGVDTVDYAEVTGNDGATNVTAAELEELTDGSTTTLHAHADDYSDISANDSATNVTGAQLEELTDGSTTTLHAHAAGATAADYDDISGNDAATDVTGAQLEELTDGSSTTLHTHAAGAAGDLADLADVTITSVSNNEILSYDLSGDWINQTYSELQILGDVSSAISPSDGDVLTYSSGSGLWDAEAPSGSSSKEYASFYLSTGGVTSVAGTETTLVLNQTSVNSDGAIFSLSSNQVTVNKTADFEVSFQVSFNSSGTARSSYGIWLDRDAATESGTYTETYQRGYDSGDTASMSIILSITSGEVFQLRVLRADGSGSAGYQDNNGTRLSFKEL